MYSFINSGKHSSSYVRCLVISLDIEIKLDEVSFVLNSCDHGCEGRENPGFNSHIPAELCW